MRASLTLLLLVVACGGGDPAPTPGDGGGDTGGAVGENIGAPCDAGVFHGVSDECGGGICTTPLLPDGGRLPCFDDGPCWTYCHLRCNSDEDCPDGPCTLGSEWGVCL